MLVISGLTKKLNLTQAITLRNKITLLPNFPQVQLLGSDGKEGIPLCIKAESLNDKHLDYLQQFAEENHLSISFEQGYCKLVNL